MLHLFGDIDKSHEIFSHGLCCLSKCLTSDCDLHSRNEKPSAEAACRFLEVRVNSGL